MSVKALFATVEVKRRPLWKIVLISPFVWFKHYRILRRHEGRIVSAYAAWWWARQMVVVASRIKP